MPTALAFSPHLDDAAFSAGGTLAALARDGWRVVMATAFTASVPHPSGFALACQLDKGLDAETDYMALRRDEDMRAAEALGIEEPIHLPFREAPHRGYDSAPALFGVVLPGDRLELNLADACEKLLQDIPPDLILAPQAVGGHVDHVQVVRALHAAAPPLPILWWRDFPYTVREVQPQEPLANVFERMTERTHVFDEACAARKAAACAAYESQIGFQFGGAQCLAERLSAEARAERFRLSGDLPATLRWNA